MSDQSVKSWNITLTEGEIRFLVKMLQNIKSWHLQSKIPPLDFEEVGDWNHIMAKIDEINTLTDRSAR